MGTSALGTLGIVLENLSSPGIVQLYNGAVAGTLSLTTQPSGSTGMRLLIIVQGNTATGTVAIAGTVLSGSSPETTPTIPIPPAGQNSLVTAFEYVTQATFTAVNASGVTCTGLTNGTITIYGIQAAKYLVPCIADIEKEYKYFIPKEARGLLDAETNMQQTVIEAKISKIDQALYPEDSLFLGYMGISNNPTVTTIPASPTSLKTSTAVSGGAMSLTTQPTTPGMKLIFTVTSSSATGTIVISGTNQFGIATSETITANGNGTNGNGTYYSANVYSAVNASGITFTGLTSGSVAVTGVFGWKYVFVPDANALYSAALEWYTGTDSHAVPWGHFTDIEVDFGVEKEVKVSFKGNCQDKLPIGDRTTNPLSASRVTALGQPTDLPMIGWQTAIYVDALTGTPGTTAYSDVIEGKIAIKVPQKPIWTSTVNQRYSRVYRQQRSVQATATIDFVNLARYEQWRKNIKEFLAFTFQGGYIGNDSGTIYNKSYQWIFPVQYAKFKEDGSKLENVTAELECKGIYDPSVSYSHKLICITQQAPVYTA